MPRETLGPISSYDLFAKSMPGVVLLLGIGVLYTHISQSPQHTQTFLIRNTNNLEFIFSFSIPLSFANFVAILIIVLLLGLLLGEGVHIFGITIERMMYYIGEWILRNIVSHLRIFYKKITVDSNGSVPEETMRQRLKEANDESEYPVNPDEYNHKHIMIILIRANNHIEEIRKTVEYRIGNISKAYWWTHNMFKEHRVLFADYISWNYTDESGPWEKYEQGELYDKFVTEFQNEYGIDLRYELSNKEIKRIYPLITSRLSIEKTGRAQKFQATYSFCRSMWVVFAALTICYLIALNLVIIPLITFIISIIFMYGTGLYKKNYIEYLMADYCTAKSLERSQDD